MAKVFAQHAEAGKYHLETRYIEPRRWEWFVLDARQTSKTVFSGDAETLEAAMRNAAANAGLYPETVKWRPIGQQVEIPD